MATLQMSSRIPSPSRPILMPIDCSGALDSYDMMELRSCPVEGILTTSLAAASARRTAWPSGPMEIDDSEKAPHFVNFALRSPASLPAAMVSGYSAINIFYRVRVLRGLPLD
jgi:hypothetical protein